MSQPFADSVDSASVSEEQDRYDELGVTRPSAISETPLGSTRTISSITVKEWIFICITGAGILASICFAIYFVATNATNPNDDFTLALLLLLNALFMLYYLIDGIFTERANELAVLIGSVVVITAYLISNFIFTQGWTSPVKIARLAFASVVAPPCIGLGASIVFEYVLAGNFIFRRVGADYRLQRLCRRLFITESGVKFDLQCTLTIVLLVLKGGVFSLLEELILGVGIAVSIVWSVLLIIAMRAESLIFSIILLILGLMQPAYICVSLVSDVQKIVNSSSPLIPDNVDFSQSLPAVSLAASAFALMVRIILMFLVVFVIRGFGNGLRDKLIPPLLRPCLGYQNQND